MNDRKIHPLEEFIFRSMLDKRISAEQQLKFIQSAIKAIAQLRLQVSFPDVYREFKNNVNGETGLIENDFKQDFLPSVESWYEHDNRVGTMLLWAATEGYPQYVRLLVENKANVSFKEDRYGTDAVYAATNFNRPTCIQELIAAKADVNTKNIKQENLTALMLAAEKGHNECLQVLIENKAALNETDKNKFTASMIAILNNQSTCLKKLIEAKADLNIRNIHGSNALILAAAEGQAECLQVLIDSKVDLNETNKNKSTAGMIAIWNNQSTCLKKLIEAKADLNIRNIHGHTALILAAGKGHSECLTILIDSKVDLNETYKNKSTAVMIAILNNKSKCLKKLIDAKADLNIRNIHGDSALILAAENGNSECLHVLIESKADLNETNQNKSTAIMYAGMNNKVKCLQQLIEAKADVNCKNILDETALILAAWKGHDECLQILIDSKAELNDCTNNKTTAVMVAVSNKQKACLQKLIKANADVNCKDIDDETALTIAAIQGHDECLQVLIDSKADLTAQNEFQCTALTLAALNNHVKCLQQLVDAKADVNHKNIHSQPTLIWSAYKENVECLKILIEGKADINAKDNNKFTALMIAASSNRSNSVDTLVNANADTSGALDIAKRNNNLEIISLLLKSQTVTPYYDLPLIQTINKIETESKLTEREIYSTLDKHLPDVSKFTDLQWSSVLIYAVINNNLAAVKWFFVNAQKYKSITKLNNRDKNGMTALIHSMAYTDTLRDSKAELVVKKRSIVDILIQHTWLQSLEIVYKFSDFLEALETIFLFNNLYALDAMVNIGILHANSKIEFFLKDLFEKVVEKNNFEMLNLLIGIIEKDNKINLKNRLIKACGSWMNDVIKKADLRMVEVLIAHDFITEACVDNDSKYTPIFWLFYRLKEKKITEKEVLQLLQLILVKCNGMQGMKNSSLIMVSAQGFVEATKLLIEHKSAINTRKSFIDSSLHSLALDAAAERGHIDIVKLLLSKGAVHTPQTVKKLDQYEKLFISQIKNSTPELEHRLENFYRTRKYLQAMQAILDKTPQVAFLCRDLNFEDQKDLYHLFEKHYLNANGWIDKLLSHYLEKVKQNNEEKPIAMMVPPSAPLDNKANAPKIPELKNEISLDGLNPDYVQHAIQQEIAENESKEAKHIQIEGQPNVISKGEQEPGHPDLQLLAENEVKSQPPLRLVPSVTFFGNGALNDDQYTDTLLRLIKQNPEYWAKYPNGNMMKKMLEAFCENVSDMLISPQQDKQRKFASK